MIRVIRCFVILSLVVLAARGSQAQVPTGAPPFSVSGGSVDVIDFANLNAHIPIPIFGRPGRGISLSYTLSYDSSVWYPTITGGTVVWTPVPNWGWRGQSEVPIGYISLKAVFGTCIAGPFNGHYTHGTYTNTSNWVYHDKFGVPHDFNITGQVLSGACGSSSSSGSATTTDDSGYTITLSGNTVTLLVDRNGAIINAPTSPNLTAGSFKDFNGNKLNVDNSGNFTDTLGSVALVTSGTPPNPVTFTYTGPAGTAVTYTVNYVTHTVQTSFGCSGISEFGPTSQSLVDNITLPDGNKYSFTYEPTPGVTGNVTGRLASVTLPTGGTISYTYTGGNYGITCTDGSAAGLTRVTPDGTWTYARTVSAAPTGAGYLTTSTTTITDPTTAQNQAVFSFQGFYPTESQVYQGSSATGTLLKTTVICYNGNKTNCTTTPISLPITEQDVTDQLPGGLQCL